MRVRGAHKRTKASDVFFDNRIKNLIDVETVGKICGVSPKTIHNWVYLRSMTPASVRLIKLPEELVGMLKRMRVEGGGGKGLVFTKNGSEALNYGTIKSVFNRGFKALSFLGALSIF